MLLAHNEHNKTINGEIIMIGITGAVEAVEVEAVEATDIVVEEVFGKFAVEIDGKIELFESEDKARQTKVAFVNEREFDDRARDWAEATIESEKARKAKINIVKSFLAFEAAL